MAGAGRTPVSVHASCPTDIVDAPIDVVWGLLTDPAGWGDFFDVRLRGIEPPGTATAGQKFWGESGPAFLHLEIRFEYTLVDEAQHKLGLDVKLPLGMTVREELDCVPLADGRCRVNYHCNFGLPGGWRGWLVRRVLGRELDEGPVDSLARLKAAAEHRNKARAKVPVGL
jgi:hypothetical protein